MAKLYPPIIAGTIPAFCKGEKIIVPFQMNRAVAIDEISGFELKIKTVQNSKLIGTLTATTSKEGYDKENNTIIFDSNKLIGQINIGQFYKIQVAYIDKSGVVGHYSTVGTIKCTDIPTVIIDGLKEKQDNIHIYQYYGIYENKDLTEKLHSYKFNLYNHLNNLIHTSDWQLYDSSKDKQIVLDQSGCSYSLNKELEENERYKIELEIITSNNLIAKSARYNLIQKKSISPGVDFKVYADADYFEEDGGIQINIKDSEDSVKNVKLYTGSFKLLRADEESKFSEWNEILAFKLFDQEAPETLFVDYTIKHGVKYKYAIVQYNEKGLQSNKIESNTVISNFEHAYLFDGNKQLKIKYNPKVSSFKEVLLESKVDTIGNKYPFIFRNGVVSYKEFPISGLISTLTDENGLFFNNDIKSTHLYRIYDYVYREAIVSDKETLYYQEVWPKLYCSVDGSALLWQTVRQYCKKMGIPVEQGYNENLFYGFKVKDPNDNKTKIEILPKGTVVDEKRYYFPSIKNQLYTTSGGSYFELSANAEYNDLEKYFLRSTVTRNNYNDKALSFTNNYGFEEIQSERDFNLEVLNWLNNGQPKLFRSPVEGNYIVRLMNSSLTPNDQLGRVLHTFNSTAYEVADYKFENLRNNNFIVAEDLTIKTIRWETIMLDRKDIDYTKNLLKYQAVALKFEGMIPGNRIYINDGITRKGLNEPGYEVTIGMTGSYNLDLSDGVQIEGVYLRDINPNDRHQGQFTYAFESAAFSSFDTIKSFSVNSVPIHQFYGQYDNVIDEINDIKNQLQKIHFIHAILREQVDVYAQYNDNNEIIHYTQGQRGKILFPTSEISLSELDRYYLYRIFEKDDKDNYIPTRFFDGYNFKELNLDETDINNGD